MLERNWIFNFEYKSPRNISFVCVEQIYWTPREGANKLARLRRDQKNCAVVTISWQSEIEMVFSLLFLLLEYFADTLSFFLGFKLG